MAEVLLQIEGIPPVACILPPEFPVPNSPPHRTPAEQESNTAPVSAVRSRVWECGGKPHVYVGQQGADSFISGYVVVGSEMLCTRNKFGHVSILCLYDRLKTEIKIMIT